jgi:hypothetical protein
VEELPAEEGTEVDAALGLEVSICLGGDLEEEPEGLLVDIGPEVGSELADKFGRAAGRWAARFLEEVPNVDVRESQAGSPCSRRSQRIALLPRHLQSSSAGDDRASESPRLLFVGREWRRNKGRGRTRARPAARTELHPSGTRALRPPPNCSHRAGG